MTDTELFSEDDKPLTNLNIKMGMPMIMMSWPMIKRFVFGMYGLNAFAIFYCIGLIVAAFKTQSSLGDFLDMVTEGDGTAIPIILGMSGLICFPLNILFAGATFMSCKKTPNRVVNSVLFTLILVGGCMAILLLVLAIVAIAHAYKIHHKLRDGIMDSMMNYKSDPKLKSRIDVLQITFQCCGSHSYEEWFEIPWHDAPLATSETEKPLKADTPFSCCLIHSPFPCIHHDLMSIGTAYLYAPESNLSVSENGCHTVISKYTRIVAWKAAAGLFGLAIIEGLVGVGTRFIQTGHIEFYRFERNSHWHTTWLVGCYKGKKAKVPPKLPPLPKELRNKHS